MSSTKFVFFGPIGKNKMDRPGLWLAESFSTFPLKPLNGIQQNLTGIKISMSFTSLCFLGRSEKQDGRPGLWLAGTFSTSPLNWIQPNLTGIKISTSSTKFEFLGPIGKTRWPPWPLIGWSIFDFSSETSELNSTKLERNQRSECPKPSLWFSDRLEKQDGHTGLWLAETFLTFPLKLLNEIQRNLTGIKISTPFTILLFFGSIGKTRLQPWPLIGCYIFDISSETAEQNSTKLDRNQDLNVLYQISCFFGRLENKMAVLFNLSIKVAHCTQVHDMLPFGGPLVQTCPKTFGSPVDIAMTKLD